MQYIILIWLTRNGKKRTAVRTISWLEKGKKEKEPKDKADGFVLFVGS